MRIVVTGAAHGLGRALAGAALNRGDEVIAIDFDGEALSQLACQTLTLDLAVKDAPERIASHGPIDLIIHCAGISGTGHFEDIPASHHARILRLNFEAPMAITSHLLVSGAMSQKSGHAFVGSLSTFTGYPGAVSYAASKDGLASFARSLDKALPKGQFAAAIYPGPMATDHASRYAPDNSEKTVAARQSPDDAAKLILDALARGKRQIVPGGKARALAIMGRVAPRLMSRALKKGLYDKLDTPRL